MAEKLYLDKEGLKAYHNKLKLSIKNNTSSAKDLTAGHIIIGSGGKAVADSGVIISNALLQGTVNVPTDAAVKNYVDQINITYDSEKQQIVLRNNQVQLGTAIDASDFIKDGMITNVNLRTEGDKKFLDIIWNTDAGKGDASLTSIDVSDLIDIYKAKIGGGLIETDRAFEIDFGAIGDANKTVSGATIQTALNELEFDSIPTDWIDGTGSLEDKLKW